MNILKKLPFYRRYSTQAHADWWAKRQIDWKKEYLDTWNHPHRYLITDVLSKFHWLSLMELGCGAGANLVNIAKGLPGKQLGGVDINPQAIELALKTFNGGMFKVSPADDVMMSDKSADVILTDMCLIYVGRWRIDKQMREIKRLARNQIVLCEFHSESWWDRLKLLWTSGYHAYDYKKLLKKHGFYDIMTLKIPPEAWPGAHIKDHRYLILAKVPKR